MRNRRIRRFRHRSNDRMHQSRHNGGDKHRIRPQTFSNGRMRNFQPQQSAEKLVEKYNLLAKEALSSGDKILSENYYQHADHFTRILIEQENHKLSQVKENQIEVISDNAKDKKEEVVKE